MIQRLKTYIGTTEDMNPVPNTTLSDSKLSVIPVQGASLNFYLPLISICNHTHLYSPHSDTQLYIIQNNSINKSHGYEHTQTHTHIRWREWWLSLFWFLEQRRAEVREWFLHCPSSYFSALLISWVYIHRQHCGPARWVNPQDVAGRRQWGEVGTEEGAASNGVHLIVVE